MKSFFVLSFVASLMLVACTTKSNQEVSVKTVVLGSPQLSGGRVGLEFPGKVKASADVSLSFRVAGQIDHIFVREGDKVFAGQLIATLDTTDYAIQLSATSAEYAQVKAQVDRVVALYADSVSTTNDYDKARYGLQQIEAKYQHHKDQLSYTRLRAPFTGYIGKVHSEANEIVAAGMPVISMVSDDRPEVEINVPAADYVRRQDFASFTCVFDVFPDKQFRLLPISWSAKANANQLYALRLKMTDVSAEKPSPGMNTMVSITLTDNVERLLSVPSVAVFERNAQTFVYAYDSISHSVNPIRVDVLNLASDGSADIKSDELTTRSQIVISGIHALTDGQQVRPLPRTTSTNVGGLL